MSSSTSIIALARQYGRYGYRRIMALLRDAGWLVNKKRVERIWRDRLYHARQSLGKRLHRKLHCPPAGGVPQRRDVLATGRQLQRFFWGRHRQPR
jgi:hypothetical protein